MDNTETQNIISFCTGYAGLELGLHLAGLNVRTVAYVEIEAFAIANLVAKVEKGLLDAAPVWTDLKTFPGEAFSGKVHGIISGYPCQPFSNAGKREGTDDPRHLWPYIEQHIRTIRPVWCFFENVSGHLTLGFEEVFKCLRDMGYSVEAGLFTAAEVGAPHKRERLFILGYSTGQRPCRGVEDDSGEQSEVLGAGLKHSLGNPDSQHGRSHTGGRDDDSETRSAGEAMAYAERPEPRTREQRIESETPELRGDRPANGSNELANTTGIGIQGDEPAGSDQSERSIDELCYDRWPARPGQEQYEWEQPRTVKSGMGRAVDGFASRVDELRLLGNGVVPACAELAFRTLWERAG